MRLFWKLEIALKCSASCRYKELMRCWRSVTRCCGARRCGESVGCDWLRLEACEWKLRLEACKWKGLGRRRSGNTILAAILTPPVATLGRAQRRPTRMAGRRPLAFGNWTSRRQQRKGKGHTKSQPLAASSWEDQRVHAVMGLVQNHAGEYRLWHEAWGDPPVGHCEDWQRFCGPAPLPGHPFWSHHQLQLRPVTSGIPSSLDHARQFRPTSPLQYFTGSTILRSTLGKLLEAAYESRNVFIVNLPEILLHRIWTHTAAEVYDRWSECEVIIGKRPRRGRGKNCSPAVGDCLLSCTS